MISNNEPKYLRQTPSKGVTHIGPIGRDALVLAVLRRRDHSSSGERDVAPIDGEALLSTAALPANASYTGASAELSSAAAGHSATHLG
jgi:hypothetical protein